MTYTPSEAMVEASGVPPRFIRTTHRGNEYVNWLGYCEVFVGEDDAAHSWCFEGTWERIDNHHHGAAARIRYLLDHGKPPKGYDWPLREWLEVYAPYRIDAKATADA